MGNCLPRKKKEEEDFNVDFQYNLVQTKNVKRKVTDDFILGQLLGEGITGKVHLVYAKPKEGVNAPQETLKKFAMKSINLERFEKSQLKELETEINLLRSLDHPNIIKIFKVYKAKKNIHIIMELLTGGELSKRILRKETEIISVSSQILSACKYWHSRNIVHRDLKLENILFVSKNSLEVKIIDFGLGCWFQNEAHNQVKAAHLQSQVSLTSNQSESKFSLPSAQSGFSKLSQFGKPKTPTKAKLQRLMLSTVGTSYFISPEVILSEGYDNSCDVFSIGCIIYILVTHKPPFPGKKEEEIFYNIVNTPPNFSSKNWSRISPEAQILVQKLLEKDPKKRSTAAEALLSPWFESTKTLTAISKCSFSEADSDIVSSFQRFVNYRWMRQAGLMVIAYQRSSGLSKLREAFQEFDIYKTGTIMFEELRIVLERYGMATKEIEQLFNKLDMDRSGQIRFMEFLAATIELEEISESEILDAFEHLDTDHSGYITKKNLRGLLGKSYSKQEIEKMILESDLTGDHKVSKNEFLQIMKGQKERNKFPLTRTDIQSALREEIADEESKKDIEQEQVTKDPILKETKTDGVVVIS
eukprot:augustus_masked-scaffold_3-processed-gene-7.49-mRNA-1 protein AED:0.08 eAED:0.08 QI:0/-1/0/1/-1/1/1/0/585